MKKNNKKAFTLLEMIVYIGLLIIASAFVISTFFWGIRQYESSSLMTEETHNIANAQIFLKKALENIDNVLLLKHKKINSHIISWDTDVTIDHNYFNQKKFSLSDLTTCWFVSNDDYDLVAYSSKDNLDPIILWVIKGFTSSWREYRQLAIYKYYSITSERSKILWDILNWNITSFINSRWKYQTDWFNAYKCDKNNWFLLPISNKSYIDQEFDFKYTSFLKRFKVVSTNRNSNIKYWNWLTEIQLEWETINKTLARTKYQFFSKMYIR